MKLKIIGADQAINEGVNQLARILDIIQSEDGIPVRLEKNGSGLSVSSDGEGYTIGYCRKVEFYRALGLLVEALKAGADVDIKQIPHFSMNGLMVDNSRNAVQTVPTIKRMLRYMALMGLSTLQLYTEDTFEIKEYPYFGYMRGRFTADEIKECDAYADMLGIELVPCVQTLAHLNQATRWKAFNDITDLGDILLVGEEKTYEFLDAMLRSVSSMFKSRRINIGMDEAHMLGLGRYLDKNGYQDRFDIMNRHLTRVLELCRKYGFKAMMWSDMFFRLSASGSYYVEDNIPQHVLDAIPPDVSMVYWDYYSESKEKYDMMIKSHFKFENPIIFAGGAWKWTGFAPAVGFSLHVGKMAIASCLENGVKEVFVTAWGDFGSECSCYSTLPTLQLYAEADYGGDLSDAGLSKRFAACTGGILADFLEMDSPNILPDNPTPGACSVNPGRYLLFQDVLCGLFDKHITEGKYNAHWHESAQRLAECARRNPQFENVFSMLSKLSSVLEIKGDIGVRLVRAYLSRDREQMARISNEDIASLNERVAALHKAFRDQWMSENKVFGFDVQDIRFGGLLARLKAAQERIGDYLAGKTDRIEELEQERLYFDARTEAGDMPHLAINRWPLMVTAGIL
jgi:hexosaminidase